MATPDASPTPHSPPPNRGRRRRTAALRWAAIGAALIGAAAVVTAVAPAATDGADSPRYGTADLRTDTDALHALGITGVQARVGTGPGSRDLVAASGTAEAGRDHPVPADGYFRIASTGKALLAAVVLQLAGEGELVLTDTVEDWLPGAVAANGNDGRRITVRHLLQHTSGLRDDLPGYSAPEDYYEQRYSPITPRQAVERALQHQPAFAPGAGWSYSNTGYALLEMIVEQAAGHPWHQEVNERILTPLGMDRTYLPGGTPGLRSPHARAYEAFPSGERTDVTDVLVAGSGGYVSTTADVNRFFSALLGGKLLSEELLAAMQDTVPVDEETQALWPGGRYGLGLINRPLSCGGSYWGHEGGESGYITLNGATGDGRRTATVSMSTALADSPENMLRQERTASDLIDRALCATPHSRGDT